MGDVAYDKIVNKLSSRTWRLNNLYYIIDVNGKKVKFEMNNIQEKLYKERWYLNLIPKARQHGITTVVDIMALDECLFKSNYTASIIAHTKADAKRIFHDKVRFPYENMPEAIKFAMKGGTDSANQLRFANGSSIKVEAAGRSGTSQFLHISEFGYIDVNYPEKAREIITGAENTVHQGNVIFIESTSAGAQGYFYDFCKRAYDKQLSDIPLTPMDYRLHFFPWWMNKLYQLESVSNDVIIYPYLIEYFDELQFKHNIKLTDKQKAWYAKKIETQGSDMYREFPSTFDEAFFVSSEGAYYRKQFIAMRKDKRICKVPFMEEYPVDTAWDIGVGDDTAIWFTQTVGREPHVINYYQSSNDGLNHYIDKLEEYKKLYGYRYNNHYAPHDMKVREFGAYNASTRWQTAYNLGVRFQIAPNIPLDDGIEQTRQFLNIAWFDEEKCSEGLIHLENYRRAWDKTNGSWKDYPVKSAHNHAADSLRYRAIMMKEPTQIGGKIPYNVKKKSINSKSWT